ncbi:MAG TPA: CHAT domain-containing protein [Pilimelia sp.]|nr:CHAT domain-containing protein [Pilimelia sp.]
MTSLEPLFELAQTDPGRLSGRIDALESVSPELAVEAAQAAFDALEAGDLVRAKAAFSVAMPLFLRIGDVPRAVRCGIQRAEIIKVLADTAEEHELARANAVAMQSLGFRLRLPDLMFNAQVVAADSAYFAAHACEQARDFEGHRKWLLVAAEDCVVALELMEADPDSGRARSLVSLVTATVQEMTGQFWSEEEKATVDQWLRRITLAVEALVPPGTGGFNAAPERQYDFARLLAQLSYDRGSPDIGRARLMSVVEAAEQAGDLVTFMNAAAALYDGERSAYRTSAELTALRLRFAGAVDEFRRLSRSRAGRLWTAQQLDEMSGEMVSDEFSRLVGRDVSRAYRALEMMRARALLDEMTGLTRNLPEPALVEQAAGLEARILHLAASSALDSVVGDQIRLASRLPLGGLHPPADLGDTLARLEEIYVRHDAGFVDTAPVGELDGILAALGPREAIISYHIPYDPVDPAGALLILLITARGALPIHLPLLRREGAEGIVGRIQADGQQPIDASPLGELIVATRLSIQEADDEAATARLAELYRVLVNPLVERGFEVGDYDTVYIVPHGILHGVPFAALRTPEGRFLAEDVATAVVPSASVWEALRRREAMPPASFLGFANPVLDGGYEPLPETETELAAVAACLAGLDTRLHIGGAASEAALRENLSGRGIVHFATHGEFPEADVMNMHRILLSAAADHDGHVNAEELRAMDFSAAALVVLSICDGGVYRFGPGDEPYGLLSALLAAGARNIVGPAWAIDDTQGRLLISEFYRRLLADGPAEALRQAAVGRMRAGVEIRDWAGFVLFGAGSWPVAGLGR